MDTVSSVAGVDGDAQPVSGPLPDHELHLLEAVADGNWLPGGRVVTAASSMGTGTSGGGEGGVGSGWAGPDSSLVPASFLRVEEARVSGTEPEISIWESDLSSRFWRMMTGLDSSSEDILEEDPGEELRSALKAGAAGLIATAAVGGAAALVSFVGMATAVAVLRGVAGSSAGLRVAAEGDSEISAGFRVTVEELVLISGGLRVAVDEKAGKSLGGAEVGRAGAGSSPSVSELVSLPGEEPESLAGAKRSVTSRRAGVGEGEESSCRVGVVTSSSDDS